MEEFKEEDGNYTENARKTAMGACRGPISPENNLSQYPFSYITSRCGSS